MGLVGAQRFSEGAELKEGEGEKRSEWGPVIGRDSIEGVGDGAGLPGGKFPHKWVGSDGAGPRRGRYLELPQLLQLAAQVAGAALQAAQVQLHLQTADGRGLPRGGAAG